MLYDRYYATIIGCQGSEREVYNFPYYAIKVARKFNEKRFQVDNENG